MYPLKASPEEIIIRHILAIDSGRTGDEAAATISKDVSSLAWRITEIQIDVIDKLDVFLQELQLDSTKATIPVLLYEYLCCVIVGLFSISEVVVFWPVDEGHDIRILLYRS